MEITKNGMFTITGRPNVGKSSLANRIAGAKISIVSDKPQTTRSRITAVCTRGDCQMIFMDTPGFHKARNRLGEYMNNVVQESVADVDAVLLVVEPEPVVGKPEALLIERLRAAEIPAILVINKMDTVPMDRMLEVVAKYREAYAFDDYIPVSALTGDGIDTLLGVLERYAVEGPGLFPEGQISDQPERQVAAEIVREKLLLTLDKEVPHGTAVAIELFEEREDGLLEIGATIYCEKDSHKGIIIGKKGAKLREIGALAREDLEAFFGVKVYLQTWVKVKENWRQSAAQLRNFGYN
jgi:GTP-binding protein Era